ncbi:hypothetical protein, partial [Streptomyces sp. NPDC055036]
MGKFPGSPDFPSAAEFPASPHPRRLPRAPGNVRCRSSPAAAEGSDPFPTRGAAGGETPGVGHALWSSGRPDGEAGRALT